MPAVLLSIGGTTLLLSELFQLSPLQPNPLIMSNKDTRHVTPLNTATRPVHPDMMTDAELELRIMDMKNQHSHGRHRDRWMAREIHEVLEILLLEQAKR